MQSFDLYPTFEERGLSKTLALFNPQASGSEVGLWQFLFFTLAQHFKQNREVPLNVIGDKDLFKDEFKWYSFEDFGKIRFYGLFEHKGERFLNIGQYNDPSAITEMVSIYFSDDMESISRFHVSSWQYRVDRETYFAMSGFHLSPLIYKTRPNILSTVIENVKIYDQVTLSTRSIL